MTKMFLVALIFNLTGHYFSPQWNKNKNSSIVKVCNELKNKRCIYNYMTPEKYVDRISGIIINESKINNIDPLLLTSIIANESAFYPNAIGKFGEKGLCQIMPHGVASETIVFQKNRVIKKRIGDESLFIPEVNLRLCANSIRSGIESCGNENWKVAGFHNLGRCPDKENRYIRNVMNIYKKLKGVIL